MKMWRNSWWKHLLQLKPDNVQKKLKRELTGHIVIKRDSGNSGAVQSTKVLLEVCCLDFHPPWNWSELSESRVSFCVFGSELCEARLKVGMSRSRPKSSGPALIWMQKSLASAINQISPDWLWIWETSGSGSHGNDEPMGQGVCWSLGCKFQPSQS